MRLEFEKADFHLGETGTLENERKHSNRVVYPAKYYDRISPCRIQRNTTLRRQIDARLF
jgi:hypothetical protein